MSTITLAPASNAVLPAPVKDRPPSIALGPRGIVLTDIDDLWRFAGYVVKAGWAPKGFTTEAAFVAVQMGMELGLAPMTAIQNIAVINGRPSIYGEIGLGMVEASGLMEDIDEFFEVGGKRSRGLPQALADDCKAVCVVSRKGRKTPVEREFSWGDAKRAGLASKDTYKGYPQRMLRYRALWAALKDAFPDVLKGVLSAEEMESIMPDEPAARPDTGRHSLRNNMPPKQIDTQPPPESEPPAAEQTIDALPSENTDADPLPEERKLSGEQAQLAMEDRLDAQASEIGQAIDQAATTLALELAGSLLMKAQASIGEDRYKSVLAKYQKRRRELQLPTLVPSRGARRADIK